MIRFASVLLQKFDDAALERRFVAYYTDYYYRFARVGLVIGLFLLLGDFLVDRIAFPDVGANFLRLWVACPLLLIAIAYSFFGSARRNWQGMMAGVLCAVSLSLFWLLSAIDAEGGMGLGSWVGVLNFTFVELYLFVILGVLFELALLVGTAIFLLFLAAIFFGLHADHAQFLYWAYHVLTLFLLAVGVGWWRESLIRRDFLVRVELEASRAAAEHMAKCKGEFLANMSHEIRTPMTAIIGMSDLCLATNLEPRQRNFVNKIKAASDALLHIINDILDFSKIEAGKLRMENTPFVLETVFEQLSGITALRAENKGIELSYDIGGDRHLLVGDPLRLLQVLTNLVTNALKFSAGGNVVVRMEEHDAADGEVELLFSVRDEGIGMSPEEVARLFQPFTQVDGSMARRFGGTGLGLAICREIVGMMKGKIWVESRPGEGSTFFFTARFGQRGMDRRQGIAGLARKLAEHAGQPVMVVDDSPLARRLLTELISQLGLPVCTAASAEEALALATAPNAPKYIACLVDWKMPGVDGLETIRRLRAVFGERDAETPSMLLVTAYSHHEDLREVEGQIDGLLAKPVSARHIYVELARCLGVFVADSHENDRRKAPVLQWSRMRNLDILLVEDVEVNQEVITELLAGVGLAVRLARNGQEALDEVARKVPDAVLMDCQMPVMDGFAATRHLRANPDLKNLPIIALTANAMLEDRERCFAAGMNAHVAKPIRIEELYERLLECLPNQFLDSDVLPVEGGEAPPPELNDFPGIDMAAGLSHVAGRLPLYLRVLKQFRDHLGATFESSFAEACAASDWEKASRLAHSLKGVAYTLGAGELGDAAMALQTACTAQDRALCEAARGEVSRHLQQVVAGLADLDSRMAAEI